MFQYGVFAEFERTMIRERVIAGLARAREEGTTLGRPPIEKQMVPHTLVARTAAMRPSGCDKVSSVNSAP
jgi:DNA invertase Pin-like site-specific DNA recombinase